MFTEMLNQMKEMQRMMLSDNEIMKNNAKLLKNMFDELKAVGFSEEQAVHIVASQGAGMKSS